jgi:hypothetical protein
MKKMAKTKKILMSVFLLSVFIFGIALISALPTLVKPASSNVISGTYVLNVTNGTMNEIINCTWYAKSALTANSSYVAITGLIANVTPSASNISTTFVSTILEDSNDYYVYATCANVTLVQNTSVASGVVIDNHVPQAPTLSPSSNQDSPRTTAVYQTFSGTVINANTTSCTYTIARGGATSGTDYFSGTAGGSASTCSFTKEFNSTVDNGDWIWSITASDGTNTTTSTNHFVVSFPGSGGGGNHQQTTSGSTNGEGSKSFGWILGIIIVLIIIFAVWGLSKKK